MIFGAALQQEMERAGLSQGQLAKRSNVKQQNISRYVSGAAEPGIETVKALADALGVPVSTLVTGRASTSTRVDYLGEVAAGKPADPGVAGKIDLADYFRLQGEVAALTVRGKSMIGLAIADGDLILIRRRPTAESGEVVVAWIGDDHDSGLTLKVYKEKKSGRFLMPRNKDSHEIELKPDDGTQLLGVYLGLIRRA